MKGRAASASRFCGNACRPFIPLSQAARAIADERLLTSLHLRLGETFSAGYILPEAPYLPYYRTTIQSILSVVKMMVYFRSLLLHCSPFLGPCPLSGTVLLIYV